MGNSGIILGRFWMSITMQVGKKGVLIFYICGPACIFDICMNNSDDSKYSTDLPVRVMATQQQQKKLKYLKFYLKM